MGERGREGQEVHAIGFLCVWEQLPCILLTPLKRP